MEGSPIRAAERIVSCVKVLPGPARDITVGVVAAAAAAASVVLGPGSDRPLLQWSLVLAAAAVLALVRRVPVVVLAVTSALTVMTDALLPSVSHVAPLAAGLSLGVVAFRHGWAVTGVSWAIAGTAVVISFGAELLGGTNGALRIMSVAAALAAPAAFGRYLAGVRQAARVAEERAHDAEERRQTATHAARMTERARLAGDLHDLVAHHVSAIAMQAGSGKFAAEHGPDPQRRLDEAVRALDAIHASSRQALLDLRGLLRVLRDPDDPAPLADPESMIADAVQRSRMAGLDVTVHMDERAAEAPLALRVTAARVVQESLTNALKHAGPGADVATTLTVSGDVLRIEIANTVPPAHRPALPASGHGLTGMRERVEILGGTFAVGPSSHGRWEVCVTLPLEVSA